MWKEPSSRRGSLHAANNYAFSLAQLKRSGEAKALLRRQIPVARRVLGEGHEIKLTMSWNYARALYENASATLNDVCEAVTTLEETKRKARRVMGRAHPVTMSIERDLRVARAALRAREAPPTSG